MVFTFNSLQRAMSMVVKILHMFTEQRSACQCEGEKGENIEFNFKSVWPTTE